MKEKPFILVVANKVTKDDTFEYQSLSSKQEEAMRV